MKKLVILAMIGMITLSCQNSNEDLTPNGESKSTFSNKTTDKGEELPKLTPEQEKDEIQSAIDFLVADRKEATSGSETARNKILCHSNYNHLFGNSCVYSEHGYLINVTWEPHTYANGSGVYPDWPIYTGTVVSQCNC